VSDADAIARAAEHDAARAGDMLLHMSFPSACDMADRPDLLAHQLRPGSPVRLAEWALRHDLDKVLAIDGRAAAKLSGHDAFKAVRRKAGTRVRLTIRRGASLETVMFALEEPR
jgi:C-terminal processing protease CtpA/Prc